MSAIAAIAVWIGVVIVIILAAKLFGALCGFNDRTPRS